MPRHTPKLFDDQVRLPVRVVYAVNHGIFKADAAARPPEVVVTGGKQLLHVIGPVYRHQLVSGLTVRRVEGDGQRQLQLQLRQTADAGNHAAGRQADMAHSNFHPLWMVDQLQEPQHIVQVVHGLPDPHQHDIGDRQAGITLGKERLVQNF